MQLLHDTQSYELDCSAKLEHVPVIVMTILVTEWDLVTPKRVINTASCKIQTKTQSCSVGCVVFPSAHSRKERPAANLNPEFPWSLNICVSTEAIVLSASLYINKR